MRPPKIAGGTEIRKLLAVAMICGVMLGTSVFALGHHRTIRGRALYYSDEFKGDHMACGPRYQPRKMVAAHPDLPCGTKLRVKNVANGLVVRVTVQDRGPYGDKHTVLDLSKRAARKLGYLSAGSARVKATVVHP